MEVCTLDLHATPYRGDELEELWAPAAARVIDYGATRYSFTCEEDDPLHFRHRSYWQERLDFERYWFSEEMERLRTETSGLYQVPILPHWGRVVTSS